jgi:hypothetical protein
MTPNHIAAIMVGSLFGSVPFIPLVWFLVWKFWPPTEEARRVAAMFDAREDWHAASEYIVSHKSGLDIWISNGPSGVSIHPDGWQSYGRGDWTVTASGSPKQRCVWRAYKKWRAWYRKQRTYGDPTLGFRVWLWNGKHLTSPYMRTVWIEPELRCVEWKESKVVRGEAGIHAERYAPSWTWQKPYYETQGPKSEIIVRGVVERFGKYVLGTEGWRAEWVVIRKLLAPTQEIGLALERAYPDVEIIYADR